MAPARRQVDQATLDEYLRERRPEGGTYNIWHNRWKGLERDWSKKGLRARFRCNPARDSGETAGSGNPNAYFCLFFAKGMCAQGPKCAMWHRVPNEDDEVETTIDCFGRDKFMEFRQDMGGVGSFNTQNKTLYVGRIAPTDDMEEVVRKHFEPFGAIEKIRLLKHRGVAFVTYKSRNNAEFAREAMMNQSLDHNEIINVRWATADPNSILGDDKEANKEQEPQIPYEESVRQNFESELPAEFTQVKRELDEDGFQEMENRAKRQREEEWAKLQSAYQYEPDYAKAIYGYTRQPTPALPAAPEEPTKKSGIVPESVLKSLKTLAGDKVLASKNATAKSSTTAGGLGSLADYGTDSEEED